MVGAEHSHTRAEFRTPERNHVLPDVSRHDLAVLRGSIIENPLNEVVSILVAGNVDQGDSSAIPASFADTIQVSTKEVCPSNLETLFDHFGRKLIGAVLGCISDDMVDGAASVGGSTMLANVLDAPVAELAVGHNVNVGQNLFNTGPLLAMSATWPARISMTS